MLPCLLIPPVRGGEAAVLLELEACEWMTSPGRRLGEGEVPGLQPQTKPEGLGMADGAGQRGTDSQDSGGEENHRDHTVYPLMYKHP